MTGKELDKALVKLIEKRNELNDLSYDNEDYDKVEEELHDLEDQFNDQYGQFFEDTLEEVHEQLSSDNEILHPIAYLAHKYKKSGKAADGTVQYDVDFTEGVFIDAEKYKGKETRLVLVPSPARFVLLIDNKKKEVIWTFKEA